MIGERLKNSVIDFAIRGDLTYREIDDDDVNITLEKLLKSKIKKEKEKKIYKKKPTIPFYDFDDIPINIPDSWKWVQLADVSIIQEGAGIRKYQYTDSGVQLLSVTNILDGQIDLLKKQLFVSTKEFLDKYTHLQLNEGDIVTACSGGSWGKVAIYDKNNVSMLNTSTLRLRFFDDLANNKFLYYIVKSEYFKKQLREQLVGMQPNFGYAHYSRIIIPLPSLAEQKRIVDKLEELLPLIDELEKDENKLNELMQKFPESMETSILKAAIQGKLTVQNGDEAVDSNLQNFYFTSKNEFEKSEYFFDLPDSWVWSKLGVIFNKHLKSKIKAGDAQTTGKYKFYNSSPIQSKYYDEYLYEGEGVLFGTGGVPSVHYINEKISYSTDCILYTLKKEVNIYVKYVYYSIRAMHEQLNSGFKGATIKHISDKYLKDFVIPIPPMHEQINIVRKMEGLLPIVAKLNENK
jgi:type I restriction enzyme, S subunit